MLADLLALPPKVKQELTPEQEPSLQQGGPDQPTPQKQALSDQVQAPFAGFDAPHELARIFGAHLESYLLETSLPGGGLFAE